MTNDNRTARWMKLNWCSKRKSTASGWSRMSRWGGEQVGFVRCGLLRDAMETGTVDRTTKPRTKFVFPFCFGHALAQFFCSLRGALKISQMKTCWWSCYESKQKISCDERFKENNTMSSKQFININNKYDRVVVLVRMYYSRYCLWATYWLLFIAGGYGLLLLSGGREIKSGNSWKTYRCGAVQSLAGWRVSVIKKWTRQRPLIT